MKRRDILLGASALTLGNALTGCTRSLSDLRVELLKNSVPVQMLNQFRRSLSDKSVLEFIPQSQLQDLYRVLQGFQPQSPGNSRNSSASNGKNSGQSDSSWLRFNPFNRGSNATTAPVADLVMIGDYWLTVAIQQGLIQSLDLALLSQWSRLPAQWQALVQRNNQGQLDSNGAIWGAPYRWGTTVIAYRTDQFERMGWEPQDWSDLWRMELRDRISLLDQPREVIGLTLRKLGHSYNTADLTAIDRLETELQQLHQNVKLYDSTTYLKPLTLGDTWLAVGWSTDLSPEVQHQYGLKVVVPRSGTRLWTDLWVRPKSALPASEAKLAAAWIDFCWQPEVAAQLGGLTGASSPIALQMNPQDLPVGLSRDPVLMPDPQIIDQSEFLYPLSESALDQYQSLWVRIRSQTRN